LPFTSAKVLENIPLTGMKRNLKFSLGDLINHRGKRVDELIKLSVDVYLEHSNYNNITEISTLLKDIGIEVEKVKGTFSDLSKLMQRRHQIVHRVDRNPQTGKAASVKKDDVKRWIDAVEKFTKEVLNEILD
jgi:hypothetical protein